jgi:AmiR/NasT family two-component response regulator
MNGDRDDEVVALTRTVEQLKQAVESRTTIGKALGIIMERLDLDDERAWGYLQRCSQHQNRRVHELARTVVETRQLPDSADRLASEEA